MKTPSIVLAAAVMLGACVLAASGRQAQKEPLAAPPLAGSDYHEIEGLYGRSLHDVGAPPDNGMAYARSFAIDGQFVAPSGTVAGQKALADMAASKRGRRFWVSNLLVEPADGGAIGWAYVVQSDASGFIEAGLYRDEWVKAKDGWRIKTRTYLPGSTWPTRDHVMARPSNPGTALTPADYSEIKNLVAQYNVGYDNAGPVDRGLFSIQVFIPEAVFDRVGAATLTGLAAVAGQSLNHKPALHHWDSNFLIAALPNGEARSFNYDMQFNVGDNGTPVKVGGAGLLHHRYVRTSDGWRIKYRNYEAVGSTPQVNWPGPEYTPFVSMLSPESGKSATSGQLSSADRIDIEQLYLRSTIAFDSAADGGMRYAETFTPDGVLIRGGDRVTGARALAAVATATAPGLHNWISNLTIEPSKDGASGRVYVLSLKIAGEPGVTTSAVTDMGTYQDALARTPKGWRFKQRTYASLPRP